MISRLVNVFFGLMAFAMWPVAVRAFILVSLVWAGRSAWSDGGGPLPGHSRHGEAFDLGPRQRAYLMGGTGEVHFPVTSKNPLVRKFIEQGVGQLHGFWYVEAERSFRQAAAIDPDCGIAYWGLSLATSELNPARSAQFAGEAAKHKAGLTDRERMYIDALKNDGGYRALIAKYPKDLEAKAFEVWRVWHLSEIGAATKSDLTNVLALAEEIVRVDPNHPLHHAVIHLLDERSAYRRGLDSAAKCGKTAPTIGHMWHMPTHIYFALKQYPEAAWQLEAATRTEHRHMMHDRILPDQVHLYAHNNEWLVRTLVHLGRIHDARRVAMEMIELPRHPLLNLIEPPAGDSESDSDDSKVQRLQEVHGTSAYYGRERLMQVLHQYEYWDELIEICGSGYIEPTRLPAERGKLLVSLGVAYYTRGEVPAGDKELAKLRELRDEQTALKNQAVAKAQERPPRERVRALSAAEAQFGRPISSLNQWVQKLENYRRIDTGFFVSRTLLIVSLLLLFAGAAFGFVWFFRRKLPLAVLTVIGAIIAAVWLFQSHLALINLPYDATNVDFAFLTRKQLDAGDPQDAVWSALNFAKARPNQVRAQANLVEILYRAGEKRAARTQFEQLRELAGVADLDSPPLARLAPIASEFGFPTDWRLPQKIQKALAGREPLESLGPLLWRPSPAPNWTLKDASGKDHSLAEFRGKPVLMVFFLGRGCLHCKQQLEAFAKKSHQISDAGLTVIAVSSDTPEGVKKSLADYKPEPFPFLMLADPKLEVFQSYRTYDDFEQIALHGTFFIDPQGLVRWHDISFEPFMDVRFVLDESKRLLGLPVAPLEQAQQTAERRFESLSSVSKRH